MSQRLLIDVLRDPELAGLDELLDDEVRFRSPYADYAGRADVRHLFGLIRQVLVELAPTLQLSGPAQTLTMFDARVAGEAVQGVLHEERDGAGRVVDAMLMLRPYAGLRAAMRAMQELMDDAPLPSAR
jgi:hypothetical protein